MTVSRSDITLTRQGILDVEATPSVCIVWEGHRRLRVPARHLDHRPVPVGRSVTTAGIILDDPHASRHHATLRARGEEVRLEDCSKNGTFVNGVQIVGEVLLSDGDVVRVGDSFLVLRLLDGPRRDDVTIAGLDGDSPGMIALRHGIVAVGPTTTRVLILGETGTGKEATASAIHARSGRRGAFVPVNCAAIPESLAESQLFGHVRGAFTDARADHPGFFRAAHGGTLFLDEVGELSAAVQAKLLRALEESVIVPVGATREVRVDVRVVAATHRDLEADVDAGRFRGDLYARLAEYTLHTVPLRARREDILPILELALGPHAPPLHADLVGALLTHPYRFNVRELLAIARQLLVDGAGAPMLGVTHAGGRLTDRPSVELPSTESVIEPRGERQPAPDRTALAALQTELAGNVSAMARRLGRSRRQVLRYLESFGLSRGGDDE